MSLFYELPKTGVILDLSGLTIVKVKTKIGFFRGALEVSNLQFNTESECNDGWRSFERFLIRNQGSIE